MAWLPKTRRLGWRQRLHKLLSFPVNCGQSGGAWRFVALSAAVHVVLFAAIFDIYFTSPVLTNIFRRHRPALDAPPANRLVLLVSDGLRAHSLFEKGLSDAPFLRQVVLERGAWGVSHTRVPTESRPGHVALIAGIYEDVASVTRGWQENAVEFDSLFNRSSATWAWGSPDIVPMFARGASPGRVHIDSYDASMEDFARHDSALLDRWVFQQVTDFLRNASQDPQLSTRLRTGHGFVFFLHLLGMDTSGHSDKPHSTNFDRTLVAVDDGVRAIEAAFEAFFQHDGRTAFVFTSDHGMTDWGSHGAGLDHETLTPLVAWGAGVRGPLPRPTSSSFQPDWPIPRQRHDVEQADVCPLMTALLGLEFPVNSVGRLPLNFLNVTPAVAACLARANALQMVEQFQLKRRLIKKASLHAFFAEAPALNPSSIQDRLRAAGEAEAGGHYRRAIEILEDLTAESIVGLYYFHRYDRFFNGVCISAIFVFWMLVLLLSTSPRLGYTFASELSSSECAVFLLLALIQVCVLVLEARPPLQWLYRLGPVYLLWCLFRQRHLACASIISFRGFLDAIVVLCGLELLIWSFFHRYLLSIAVLVNSVWVIYACLSSQRRWQPSFRLTSFFLASLVLAYFPLLPVIGGEMRPIVVLIGPLASGLTLAYILSRSSFRRKYPFRAFVILSVQLVLLVWASVSHAVVHASIRNRHGLPLALQISSWTIVVVSVVLVLLVRQTKVTKVTLLSLLTAVSAVYCLLSIYYETVFLFALSVSVVSWVSLEREQNAVRSCGKATPSTQLLRYCFTYMLFMILCFFGTGNIASINSFDPQSVFCFITVFQPFMMGGLMLVKIVLPMLITTCVFALIVGDVQISLLSRVTMVLADFMALHFFFFIRDWGSWLEIGTSISHYVISMAFTVVVSLFIAFARLLLPKGNDLESMKKL